MHPSSSKKIWKNAPQARFFLKQNAPQAKLITQNAPQARFFDQVLMGTLLMMPIDITCNLFFTNHSSEYSSFNWLINELINELINLWPSYSTVVFPTAVRSTRLCHWVGGSWGEQSWPPIQWGILFESCCPGLLLSCIPRLSWCCQSPIWSWWTIYEDSILCLIAVEQSLKDAITAPRWSCCDRMRFPAVEDEINASMHNNSTSECPEKQDVCWLAISVVVRWLHAKAVMRCAVVDVSGEN